MILYDSDRVVSLMNAQGIDVLLPHTQPNAGYLSDYWSHWIKSPYYRGEEGARYWLFVGLPRDPHIEPFITCRTGGEESDMAFSQVWIQDKRLWGPTSPARDAVSAFGGDHRVAMDAIQAATWALTDRGLETARIGVEMTHLSVHTLNRLREALPGARFVDATGLFEEVRVCKGEEEIRRLQMAAQVTEQAFASTFHQMEPGMTGFDLEKMLASSHIEQGAQHYFTHVNLGPRGVVVINPSEEQVRTGEIVRLDTGCNFKDYLSDISRVAIIGEPRSGLRELYQATQRGYAAMFDCVKVGVKCSTVYSTVASALADQGLALFCAMVGHGVGRDIHEAPYITAGNQEPLQANNVITIEIALMVPEFGAMCLEDMVVVKENGPLPLSTHGKILESLG